MADYKKLYDSLFNGVTDVIALLQRAQQETEEMFMSGNNGKVYEVPKKSEPEGTPEQ